MPDTKELFNKVAKNYDKLNSIFSFGIHNLWRKKLAREITKEGLILDVATGTCDVALAISSKSSSSNIVGIDPSIKMLEIGSKKIRKRNPDETIQLVSGVAEKLPFEDNVFDYATIAFGIRNTVDYQKSLSEILRVLKKDGKLLILEFAVPENKIFRPLYLFYFKKIMPFIGSLYGRGKEYGYLAESTMAFPQREKFIQSMQECGYKRCSFDELTMGTVILYSGWKN